MPWDSLLPLIPGTDAQRASALERLRQFVVELLKWNQGVSNLISHDDQPRLVERHVAESLAGAEIINRLGCKELVDFGSGGGFPAIPLSIVGVGAKWTLVESRRNKSLFLRRAVQELELKGIKVLTGRLEVLVEDGAAELTCDGFTSRATAKLGPTLALAARIVAPGGHAILWKGSGVNDELAEAATALAADWEPPQLRQIGEGPNSIVVLKRKSAD